MIIISSNYRIADRLSTSPPLNKISWEYTFCSTSKLNNF